MGLGGALGLAEKSRFLRLRLRNGNAKGLRNGDANGVESVHSHPCAMKLRMDGAPEHLWPVREKQIPSLRCGMEMQKALRGEVVEKGLHFAGGVGVSGTLGGFDAFFEARNSFVAAVEFRQGLRGHLVGGDVVWVVLDEG